MSILRSRARGRAHVTWLACAAALASACLENPTLRPGPVATRDAGTSDPDNSEGPDGPDGPDGTGGEPLAPTTTLIGQGGGELLVEGLAQIEVPAAALIEDRELRAREIPAEQLPAPLPLGAIARTVELTPHGQLF